MWLNFPDDRLVLDAGQGTWRNDGFFEKQAVTDIGFRQDDRVDDFRRLVND